MLFEEEKLGLRTVFKKFNIVFSFYFLFSIDIYPQVPINGFCKFTDVKVDSGFTSILPLNYNGDLFSDLLLYNPDSKNVLLLEGDRQREFGNRKLFPVPVQFSKIKNIYNSSHENIGYAFTSRSKLFAGIYNIDDDGDFKLYKIKKFKYYPDNISIADVKSNGDNEYLISGSVFQGLSLLKVNNFDFEERSITTKASYSTSTFVDLNSDSYPDIAAFNIITNSIDFFYNNSRGVFKLVRSIPTSDKISSLYSIDFDKDSYEDLLYIEGNTIRIKYGDFTSSYDSVLTINTNYRPDKFIVADFNNDGHNDIAYLNSETGIVSIIFFKDKFDYFPEILYLKRNGITDITQYSDRLISSIAAINSSGYVYLISNIKRGIYDYNISLAAEPSIVSTFDYGSDKIKGICYTDIFDNSLKIILRGKNRLPDLFYSYPLFEFHSKIFIDGSMPDIKTFYLYEPGKKLIEIVKGNLEENKFERSSLYSPGGIKDVKIIKDNDKDKIYVAYTKDDKLNLALFIYSNYRYNYANYSDISEKTFAECIDGGSKMSVYYWKKENDNAVLFRYFVGERLSQQKILYTLPLNRNSNFISISADVFNRGDDVVLNFVQSKGKNFILITDDSLNSAIYYSNSSEKFRIKNKNQLFFDAAGINGRKNLFLYDSDDKLLKRFEFSSDYKTYKLIPLTKVENLENYSIVNFEPRYYDILYTDSLKNCLTIKPIK